jgi:hypothetical protein
MKPRVLTAAMTLIGLAACAGAPPRFPLRPPVWRDTDTISVSVPCRVAPTPKDASHVVCAPASYESPLIWDGVDSLVFRPISDFFALRPESEAVDVNSMDEVPDSSWFVNRVGTQPWTTDQMKSAACSESQRLNGATAGAGAWVIDAGKATGSTSGFRVTVEGHGKYLFKSDEADQPERPSAAQVIGAAVYHAAGFNAPCDQIVYFRPEVLRLKPGLRYRKNFGDEEPFDRAALDAILAKLPRRGDALRMVASAWIPGRVLGPFRYEGTRDDDPNDVVPHEERRELRGSRLLAAWIDRVDAREANTLDSWVADRPDRPDSSPGHVLHYMIDTSECLGPAWDWEEITRRLGHSYVFDWGDFAGDFATLGIPRRPWDTTRKAPGHLAFAYFNVEDFVPDRWKMEYANPAFSRMTERDGAWMARILARFTPPIVHAIAEMAEFSDPAQTLYLERVLEGRLERILDRYLTRLSSLADVRFADADLLCAVDLAERRRVRDPARFQYSTAMRGGRLPVQRRGDGEICVSLPHVPDDRYPDEAPERYVTIRVDDGVAGALVVHAYDLGTTRGYRLAGLERLPP